ncbi:MAG: AMP-binding protein [Gammaproteobacteria bacterium]|nr:AMP-binding protein [Gammaproteobacteria bacterium]MDE0365481.1 AMP-binding protein [Gammaproteobacteria bacterium]
MPESLLSLLGRDSASIPEVFARRAERSPDATFLIWEGSAWSYRRSLEVITGFAGFLMRSAERAGRLRVATFLRNCPEAMWAWLGTCFAGGVAVPLNRNHRGALLTDMVRRSGATVLVTDARALSELPSPESLGIDLVVLADTVPEKSAIPMLRFADAQDPRAYNAVRLTPSAPACLLYTSGTTGRSKAVLVPHNQYCRGAGHLVDSFGLRADDVFHNWLPLYHLGGQLHMTMTSVICGGAVALFPTFSRSQFRAQVRGTGASVLCGFEPILRFIWSLPRRASDARSSLRVGIFAGIPPDLKRKFESRFGIRIAENYGMTEADPITHPYPDVEPPDGSCGLAGRDFDISILGPDDRPLAPGNLGEIAVRPLVPDVMALGYESDRDAFRHAFRSNWFHTGDLGTLDEAGFLYFKGRLGNYIRRRGENVSVAELEEIVSGHDSVLECAAVAVPSEVGEDDIKLVVVPTRDSAITPSQMHAFAQSRMAAFMVPRYIEVVDALPRGELGKVKLAELKNVGLHVWDVLGQ